MSMSVTTPRRYGAAAVCSPPWCPMCAREREHNAADAERQTLPVVEEQLKVGKRQVEGGGVRVFTHTSERPVEEQVTLREERASVERRPVDRPASDADLAAFKEGSIEV